MPPPYWGSVCMHDFVFFPLTYLCASFSFSCYISCAHIFTLPCHYPYCSSSFLLCCPEVFQLSSWAIVRHPYILSGDHFLPNGRRPGSCFVYLVSLSPLFLPGVRFLFHGDQQRLHPLWCLSKMKSCRPYSSREQVELVFKTLGADLQWCLLFAL